jgi:purine-binding chemotaxis protein CheW
LPGAPHFVSGLINLRGRVVTVLDLGRHFGGGSVDPDAGSIVLIEHGARLVGLAVDEVRDVQPLRDADLDAVGGEAARDGVVRGLGRVDGGTVVVLDVRAMAARILL